MKILVGMSGGVDSSVAALLLKQQGHEVIGTTMTLWGKGGIYEKLYDQMGALKINNSCLKPNEQASIDAVKIICEEIGIPLYVFDCSKEYENSVLNNFRKEYLNGRTPNPCVWCNSLIKFKALPCLAKKKGINFDKFATGHYARIENIGGIFFLKKAVDLDKDQSYFLSRLESSQLENILFPLGVYTKNMVRDIAKKHNMKVADKPDSQDFYGGNYKELLQVNNRIGYIVNRAGKVLGQHQGIWNYTIGQRKGLRVSSDKPLYVVSLNKDKNEVVVDYEDQTMKNKLIAVKINWLGIDNLGDQLDCCAKIRSSHQVQKVKVIPLKNGDLQVEFINLQKAISPGQTIAFYQDDLVLGSGIIDVVL